MLRLLDLLRLLFLAALLAGLLPALVSAAESPRSDGAVVLMYHRFGEDGIPSTNTPLAQFDAHLKTLAAAGRPVVPLERVVEALRGGPALPDGAVALTIDDAYASVYRHAWPRLRAAGLPVTLFVATEPVGGRGYMTWDDIRAMRDGGATIGMHMHAHPHMPAQTAAAQRADLDTALALFERELGERPTLFAYPYGEADARAIALVREAGFLAAFGQHSGVAAPGEDPFYLPRFALNTTYGTPERFARVLGALPIPATWDAPAAPAVEARREAFPLPVGFTVTDPDLDLGRLACYGPDGQALPLTVDGRRVATVLPGPQKPGRARLNCTLPGPKGADGAVRWRWRGTQITVLPAGGLPRD